MTTFAEAIEKAKRTRAESAFHVNRQPASEISLEHADIRLPSGELLLGDVNLKLARRQSVVVTGPSGSGKTTLFRVLAGIWPYGCGQASLPRNGRMLFLPQRPYLPTGTLKEILTYPENAECCTDEACREVLEACSLAKLAPRLSESTNWSLVLSGGEQQRIAFARHTYALSSAGIVS